MLKFFFVFFMKFLQIGIFFSVLMIRNSMIRLNSVRLFNSEDSCVSVVVESVLSIVMKLVSSNVLGIRQVSIIGFYKCRCCISVIDSRLVRVEVLVVRRIGRNIRVGLVVFCCVWYMKIVIGSRVRDEVLSIRKRICVLFVVVLLGLSFCNVFIVFRLIGVVVLFRFRLLVVKFRVIRLIVGCFGGIFGISWWNSGLSSIVRCFISLVFLVMCRKLSQSVRVLNSRIIILIVSLVMVNRFFIIVVNIVVLLLINQCVSVFVVVIRKKFNYKLFSIQNFLCCVDDSGVGGVGVRNVEVLDDVGVFWVGSCFI